MSTFFDKNLNSGIAYLQKNNLVKAEETFRRVLQLDPHNAEGLNLLGVVKEQQGDPESAIALLERALASDTSKLPEISYLANLSNSLISAKKYSEAEQYCLAILKQTSNYVPVFYHLARICFFTQRLDKAIHYCLKAIAIDHNSLQTLCLLAQIYVDQDKWQAAEEIYQQLLPAMPNATEILFGVGLVNHQQGNLAVAERYYKEALKSDPNLSEAYNGLGGIYYAQGQLQRAFGLFYQALKKNQANVDAHYNQGLVLRGLGKLNEAVVALQQAITLQPQHCSALASLGLTYQELGQTKKAQALYSKVLGIGPNNSLAEHMLAALTGENTSKAPNAFVTDLFDAYAPSYDQHLQSVLEFSAPELIRSALLRYCEAQLPFAVGLDLGCGTGLLAEALGPMLTEIDGVDLSPKMLALAESKGVYRKLINGDMKDCLAELENKLDCCLASDVFIYIGDLQGIFTLAYAALKINGIFVFTTEISQKPGFHLLSSGRYAHSNDYIVELAAQGGFEIKRQISAELRKEGDHWLKGYVYILQKC